MISAGKAIADEVEAAAKRLGVKDICVVCGTGNNGGDGYICAKELVSRGFDVGVYALCGKLSEECQTAKNGYNGRYLNHIAGAIIVDCIFGIGLCRKVEGEIAEVINAINASGAYVISADIPSGLSGDNGLPLGVAVKANLTVAVAEYKTGHFLNDAPDYCGQLVKKDIGIVCPQDNYAEVYEDSDLSGFFPRRRRNTYKGSYGTACLITGSDKYIGAAALAVNAALKSGCGYVKLLSDEKVKLSLAPKFPQTIFSDEVDLSAEAIAVGSGCGVSEELHKKICALLKDYRGKLIIDADGLNALSRYGKEVLKDKNCEVLITPHAKEFSRLTGLSTEEILKSPVTAAKNFAKEYNVTVLLKGAASVITDGARTVINTRGNTALSKGGSGDMLTGFACGTAARGLKLFDSAVCAAYVLGGAAEISADEVTEYCATACEIIKNLPVFVKRLTRR